MPALLEKGQQFYGWRGPTELEFQEFLSNAGYEGLIFDIYPVSDPEILQQAESFARLLGTTNTSQDTYTVTAGMIMPPAVISIAQYL